MATLPRQTLPMLSLPCPNVPLWEGACHAPGARVVAAAQGPPGPLAVETSAAWFLGPIEPAVAGRSHCADRDGTSPRGFSPGQQPSGLLGALTWDPRGTIWQLVWQNFCTRCPGTPSFTSSGATGLCSWPSGTITGKDSPSPPSRHPAPQGTAETTHGDAPQSSWERATGLSS